MKRRVQTLSRGLAEVTSPVRQGLFGREGPIGSGRVQFIHQSVKDFFVEKGLSALDETAKPDFVVGIAYHRLSRTCIRYLAMEEIDSEGRIPLSWAAENGHETVVRLLVDWGACTEAADKMWSWTPLLRAAENGHEAIVWLLVDRGAYTEAVDEGGQTPLWWAAENGHEAIVWLLVDRGACTEAADKIWGQIPLSRAAENRHEVVVWLLVDRGAYTEAADKGG
ncbi:hypothetical protein NW757_013249 [Fusarium falciforme]|nr:hypothetical protein NW757_013249 [Fusarium falciforme]